MDEFFIDKYKKCHNDVYRLAYSYTLNKSDSEDIVQKVFLKFYSNISKFVSKNDDDIKKWLIKVSVNETKDFLKSFWKVHKEDNLDFINYSLEETNKYNLFEALRNINKKYRLPFYLYYYEGYDINEISKMMNLSVSCIKSRLSRGKEKLRKELDK